MNAAVVNILGQPPKFQDFSEPVAGDGEVVVEMLAAGLHPIVKARAAGSHYSSNSRVPFVAGIDGVGRMPDGSLVYCFAARPPFGAMAQRTVIAAGRNIPLPSGLAPEQAAAIANPGISAWISLKSRAALAPGETVLINGATGIAGQLAVQAARGLGAAKVIATGRNQVMLAALGADAVIDLTAPEEAIAEASAAQVGAGIDVIIDYLWGRPIELLLGALATSFRPQGSKRVRLVQVGESAGKTIALAATLLRSIDLNICGSGFGSVPMEEIIGAIPTLFALAAEGRLRAEVEVVPLSEVEAAWTRVEKGKRLVFAIQK